MRVKISKTLSIDEIAGETRRMIDRAKNRVMYSMSDDMSTITRASLSNDGNQYFQAIELIQQFRSKLESLTEDLKEIETIMEGHKNIIMPEPERPEHDEEWLANEQAEYEKFMSQVQGSEEGFHEEG